MWFGNALLEWQTNKGIHPKAFKSKVKADKPDRSNDFNYKNDGGKIASCFAAPGRKLLNLPGVPDTYTFLINTWNTQPARYRHMVYKNTPATVKRPIQRAENPTPAAVINTAAAHVDNASLIEYLTCKVELDEPENRSTDRNIPINNN
jgi:hypothetical protein